MERLRQGRKIRLDNEEDLEYLDGKIEGARLLMAAFLRHQGIQETPVALDLIGQITDQFPEGAYWEGFRAGSDIGNLFDVLGRPLELPVRRG